MNCQHLAFVDCVCVCVPSAAPGIISASPYAGAHGFPPAFAIQQAAGQLVLGSQAGLIPLGDIQCVVA